MRRASGPCEGLGIPIHTAQLIEKGLKMKNVKITQAQ